MAEKMTFSDDNCHIITHWAYKTLPLHVAVIGRDPRGPFHRRRSSDMTNADITAGKLPKFHHKWWDYFNGVLTEMVSGSTPQVVASLREVVLCSPTPRPSFLFISLCLLEVATDTMYAHQDMSNGRCKWWWYNLWGVRKNCERFPS